MNSVSKLVERLCPEGVKWVKLSDLCDFRNGYTPSRNNDSFWNGGDIPWFVMEDIRENGNILSDSKQHITAKAVKGKGLFKANSIIIATSATIGVHALILTDFLCNQRFTSLFPKDSFANTLSIKYLFYYMDIVDEWCLNHTHQGGFASVDMEGLKNLEIPLPPKEVQEELVSILDGFTKVIDKIDELIKLRQQQFEYYREKLLSFEEGEDSVEWKGLNSICEVINGRAYKQSELLSEGKYRVLRVGNFFSNDSWYYSDLELEDKYYCDSGDLLYAWSASFGPHIWDEERVIYHYHIWKMICKKDVLQKYMYYWLLSNSMQDQVASEKHGATMAHLTKALMESLSVPVPPLTKQEEIVDILDKFEEVIEKLKKKRDLRQKQYEYYREALLTF